MGELKYIIESEGKVRAGFEGMGRLQTTRKEISWSSHRHGRTYIYRCTYKVEIRGFDDVVNEVHEMLSKSIL